MLAAERGHIDVVDLLIEHDAQIDMRAKVTKNLVDNRQLRQF